MRVHTHAHSEKQVFLFSPQHVSLFRQTATLNIFTLMASQKIPKVQSPYPSQVQITTFNLNHQR